MLKNEKKTGDRINELIQERGILKKHFAVDMGVTQQAVSAWISNKSMPAPEMLKKIAQYFGVDYRYLTCERDFKNWYDARENAHNKAVARDMAINNLLESYGYSINNTGYFVNGRDIFNGCEDIDFLHNDAILEVTTPNDEKFYVKSSNITGVVDDMFALLDRRLAHNDITFDFDMSFDDLKSEIE